MLVILGSLFLPLASRMASQAKEVEMLSTEELQRNQQLISQIYTMVEDITELCDEPGSPTSLAKPNDCLVPSRYTVQVFMAFFCGLLLDMVGASFFGHR